MTEIDLATRVGVALIIGLMLGVERELRGHAAGLRTMTLITGGAALFTALGVMQDASGTDPTRIAAQIATGVGFLGAGAIIRDGVDIKGLTTAASIWVAAALGMAVGFGYIGSTFFITLLVLIVLMALKKVELQLFPGKRE